MEDRDDKSRELNEAYEADKKLRAVREEELQAAKDYLGVLLGEIETKNRELEAVKREADDLKRMLAKSDGENESKKNRNIRHKNGSTFWLAMSLFEAVIVIVLLVMMLVNTGRDKSEKQPQEVMPTQAAVQDPDENPDDSVEARQTEKFCTDLQPLIDRFNASASEGEFTAGLINKNSFEYLSFMNSAVSIAYRNEYASSQDVFKKSIIIENGVKRLELVYGYDFDGGAEPLCPRVINVDGRGRTLVLMTGMSEVGGIPAEILFIDEQTLTEYPLYSFSGALGSLVSLEYLNTLSALEEAPVQFTLTARDKVYNYAIPDSTYTDLVYNGDSELRLDSGFVMSIEEDGVCFETLVMLSDNLYLGKLSGKLTVIDGAAAFTDVRFAAFAGPDQEDSDKLGLIRPMEELPDNYIRIGGITGLTYLVPVNPNVEPMSYSLDNLNTDDPNNWLYYDEDGSVASVKGIDVSKYQGNIDWNRVKNDGVEFAIIRLGYRGWGEGTLELDNYFKQNIKGALDAGVQVGVYFFSQAVDTGEAVEEAEFVLSQINGYDVSLPVVFDTEYVTADNARANILSRQQRTDICRVFCARIDEAGYTPMIYANTRYMVMGIDLEQLSEYGRWFAYYGKEITFPYSFDILQYTESGRVDGIDGPVDINLWFNR